MRLARAPGPRDLRRTRQRLLLAFILALPMKSCSIKPVVADAPWDVRSRLLDAGYSPA
jgi:hypothetical protein